MKIAMSVAHIPRLYKILQLAGPNKLEGLTINMNNRDLDVNLLTKMLLNFHQLESVRIKYFNTIDLYPFQKLKLPNLHYLDLKRGTINNLKSIKDLTALIRLDLSESRFPNLSFEQFLEMNFTFKNTLEILDISFSIFTDINIQDQQLISNELTTKIKKKFLN